MLPIVGTWQAAGWASGGSLIVRNPSTDVASTEMSTVSESETFSATDPNQSLIAERFASIQTSANNCDSDRESEGSTSHFSGRTLSWHEHVYRKLNTRPTPHYIENILGLSDNLSELDDVCDIERNGSMTVVSDFGDDSLKLELNEPLNLSIKCNNRVRTKTDKGTSYQIFVLFA